MARTSQIVNTASIKLTSAEEVLRVLKTILDDKAPGPDGIPNKVLKIAIKANTNKEERYSRVRRYSDTRYSAKGTKGKFRYPLLS